MLCFRSQVTARLAGRLSSPLQTANDTASSELLHFPERGLFGVSTPH